MTVRCVMNWNRGCTVKTGRVGRMFSAIPFGSQLAFAYGVESLLNSARLQITLGDSEKLRRSEMLCKSPEGYWDSQTTLKGTRFRKVFITKWQQNAMM